MSGSELFNLDNLRLFHYMHEINHNQTVTLGDLLLYIMNSANYGNRRNCPLFYIRLFNHLVFVEGAGYEREKIEILLTGAREKRDGALIYMMHGNPRNHVRNVIREQYVDTSLEISKIDYRELYFYIADELLNHHCGDELLNTVLYQP